MALKNATDISAFFMANSTLRTIGKTAVYHDPSPCPGLEIRKERGTYQKSRALNFWMRALQNAAVLAGSSVLQKGIIAESPEKSSKKLLLTQAEAVVTSFPGCIAATGRADYRPPCACTLSADRRGYCHRQQGRTLDSLADSLISQQMRMQDSLFLRGTCVFACMFLCRGNPCGAFFNPGRHKTCP